MLEHRVELVDSIKDAVGIWAEVWPQSTVCRSAHRLHAALCTVHASQVAKGNDAEGLNSGMRLCANAVVSMHLLWPSTVHRRYIHLLMKLSKA